MARLLRASAAIGCFYCYCACSIPEALADDAVDIWLAQRLSQRVNIDVERDDYFGRLKQLSQAIGVPIDVDSRSLQLLGITSCQSYPLKQGEKPAIELLEWLALGIGREDRVTFIVTDDEQKRTPAAVRILVVSRESLPKHSAILPPHDSAAADKLLEERLSQNVNLPAANDTLAVHLERLSAAVGLPIELDSKSVDDGITPNPSFAIPAGERPSLELLASMLKQASPDKPLGCYLADDAKKRTPHEVRIVVAARSVLENNPARFTSPPFRPMEMEGPEIAKLLATPVSLQLTNKPLLESVGLLAKQAKAKIDWDYDAVWKHELDRDKPTSADATNQPLGTVLQKMLADAGTAEHPLVFTVWRMPAEGVKLVITSRTAAERKHWTLPDLYREADQGETAVKKD